MLSLDTAYRSLGGEVEASSTPTICRLSDSRRHQLSAIAPTAKCVGPGFTGAARKLGTCSGPPEFEPSRRASVCPFHVSLALSHGHGYDPDGLGKSGVRERRLPESVRAKPNGLVVHHR